LTNPDLQPGHSHLMGKRTVEVPGSGLGNSEGCSLPSAEVIRAADI